MTNPPRGDGELLERGSLHPYHRSRYNVPLSSFRDLPPVQCPLSAGRGGWETLPTGPMTDDKR